MKPFFFLIFLTLLSSGCDLRQREEALANRENLLNQKEQELLVKE